MHMDMNFPHRHRAAEAGLQAADYFALVATVTAAQASSRTVRALLHGARDVAGGNDILESRIGFFAQRPAKSARHARGAFLPALIEEHASTPSKFEFAVNPAGSTYVKADWLETIRPETQVAERGTEY